MRLRSEVWQHGKVVSSSNQPLDTEAHTLYVKVVLGDDGTVSLTIDTHRAAPPSTASGGIAGDDPPKP